MYIRLTYSLGFNALTHTDIHMSVHTYIYTYLDTYMHTCNRHTGILAYIHPYVHTWTHTHTYTYTYVHMYVHISPQSSLSKVEGLMLFQHSSQGGSRKLLHARSLRQPWTSWSSARSVVNELRPSDLYTTAYRPDTVPRSAWLRFEAQHGLAASRASGGSSTETRSHALGLQGLTECCWVFC